MAFWVAAALAVSALTAGYSIHENEKSKRKSARHRREQLAYEAESLAEQKLEMQAEAEAQAKEATDQASLTYKKNDATYKQYYGELAVFFGRGASSRGGFTTDAGFSALNRNALLDLNESKQDVIKASEVQKLDFSKMDRAATIRVLGISAQAAAEKSQYNMSLINNVGSLLNSGAQFAQTFQSSKTSSTDTNLNS